MSKLRAEFTGAPGHFRGIQIVGDALSALGYRKVFSTDWLPK